jgi:signal transduction histidine kinase
MKLPALLRRLVPRSLGGQMALLLGIALLVAQVVNLGLILNERQKLSLAQNQEPAITRFAGLAADIHQAAPEFHAALLSDASHRGARFAFDKDSRIAEGERHAAIEERLTRELADSGIHPTAVRAALGPPEQRAGRAGRPPSDRQLLRLAIAREDGSWLVGRIVTPRRDPWFATRLAAATLLLYLLVLGAGVWIAMRLARPLRDLTRAADAFGGRSEPVSVPSRGPSDLRRAIEAFNAMNRRLLALLDEKDRMLGAIGHDLRTPLASLRIRVESMEPETEREAAIAKIGEINAMLEDILVLARSGRAREQARPVDVAALAEALVEECRGLGEKVEFLPSERRVAQVQPALLRRALRNLVDNAVKYGGNARVAVVSQGDELAITVTDDGPGIPPEEIERSRQPFYRLEASRNRETGGSGLGLAIAQAIAESHGGRLELRAGQPRGLSATIILPAAPGG